MRQDLVGRDAMVADADGELTAGRSLLVFGPAGVGKSSVARALEEARTADGWRVLGASPSRSESGLPYVTLVDLLGPVWDSAREHLPPHLRQPLEVALLKTGTPDSVRDELAVRLAVLQVLRRLAANARVLVFIDDVQWVDPSSLEVLTFCARRLRGEVQVLVTEQVAAGDAPARAQVCPDDVVHLEVTGLPERQVSVLLRTALGEVLPVRTVKRIYAASDGNPFLALELGRAVLRHVERLAPDDPLPVSSRLKSLLGDRLSEMKPATREMLLVAASAPRPTVAVLTRACGPSAGAALDEAERLGLVAVSGTSVRFTHSLLSEFIYAEATSDERREAHRRLAAVIDEPVEKVRHYALATPGEDAELAAHLDQAADAARDRGAPSTAAALSRLAADRTPLGEREPQADRLLRAARDAQTAGLVAESSEAARLAMRVTEQLGTRVEARLLLTENNFGDRQQRNELLDQAFAEASGYDERLEAKVRVMRGESAYFDRRIDDAFDEVTTGMSLARRCGDVAVLIDALQVAAAIETLAGDGADAMHREAGELAAGRELTSGVVGARQMAAMTALFQGRTEDAWQQITSLVEEIRSRGAMRWLFSALISATAINERSGRAAEALQLGRECCRLGQDIDDEPEVGLLIAARVELIGGSVADGERLATEAVAACREVGNDEWLPLALMSVSLAKLLSGDARAAYVAATEAIETEPDMLTNDPAVIPWHADYIETVIAVGELAEAERLITETRARVEKLGRTVVSICVARADALRVAKAGDPATALTMLDTAIDELAGCSYPLDVARCELARARVARQARRRSFARMAYAAAVERFDAIGAVPWREIARAELARLDDPGRQGAADLTEAERSIVEMLRSGATNREIAGSLYLSVKAVESQLTRLYRRYHVRNRTQLLRAVDDQA